MAGFTAVNYPDSESEIFRWGLGPTVSEFQLFSVVLLLCAGQGLFLALALVTSKSGNWVANRYLGVFTLMIAIVVFDFSLGDDGQPYTYYIRSVLWPRDFIFGPALYFYVREVTQPGRYRLAPRQWLHFLPAILHVSLYWLMPLFNSPLHVAIITDDFNSATAMGESLINYEVYSSVLHVAIYLFLSVRLLNRHDTHIKDTFSYVERINLRWLRRLLFGVIVVYAIWILEEFISDLIGLEDTFFALLGGSMVVLIYTMSYLGLRQPLIFTESHGPAVQNRKSEEKLSNDAQDLKEEGSVKYKTSSLSPDLSKGLLDELQQLMEKKKLYLDAKLSLPRLAEELRVSANYLSQVINEQLNLNFFDFVNGYRVEEAKGRLTDDKGKNANILVVANDSGFNSKSAFYSAFKKHTGMTPGEFRKRHSRTATGASETISNSQPKPHQ